MRPEDKRVDITIDRIVIREVEGRHGALELETANLIKFIRPTTPDA